MVRQLRSEGVRWYDLFGVNPVTTPGTYQFKTGLAGNLGQQLTYLGEFDYCSNGWSAAAVRTGEKIRAANARLRSVINLSNRISPWK
jgi:lipid II:glycine glycyltransferase (peptidoglycan interpeptide bridge formation enzyme)